MLEGGGEGLDPKPLVRGEEGKDHVQPERRLCAQGVEEGGGGEEEEGRVGRRRGRRRRREEVDEEEEDGEGRRRNDEVWPRVWS